MIDFEFLIHAQALRYPQLEPQDVCKAVFQAVLGPRHLLTDPAAVELSIRNEIGSVRPFGSHNMIEQLGTRFIRLHLGAVMSSGLSIRTLAQMFMLSTKVQVGNDDELATGAETVLRFAEAGRFGFTADEGRLFVNRWRDGGFPVLSHSDKFHDIYKPAYRVIAHQFVPLLPMFCRIDGRLREGGRVVLAIDGMSCSGKTTLANIMGSIYGCPVFHADDFFPQAHQRTSERLRIPGGNLDRERLYEQVLKPLRDGAEEITFNAFDCNTMTMGEPQTVKVGQLAIVEGSYSMHPDLKSCYTDTAYIQVSPQLQRQRLMVRNPDKQELFINKWIPMENIYIDATQVARRCEFMFDAEELQFEERQ